MLNEEPIEVTMQVVNVLEKLGINYVIGGSLASALHGAARATMDSDLIADFREEHAAPFVESLKLTFYVDDEMIRDAIRTRRSFNIIHLQTFFRLIFLWRKNGNLIVSKLRDENRIYFLKSQVGLHLLPARKIQFWQNWSGIEWAGKSLTGNGRIYSA